ncbi:UvrD-helicase domain-containing protein [Pantoea trifolii]|uniref:UvrD-helicase domain-containing protein n=1 Tax=Pantoea trifolii TaxID=2968030 RepID=A0ABT1VIV8_9GAMM|nr:MULTISPECIES: UvrD-helicase domain-containing protein [unclassified Pantoea]MCQ8227453.1 UvrD-helicase domain-containing protein [Pantoea sp. MMK2]MCQ8235625.1 UvrD-helicase domain-containing protein [Pantoea sp. MMK3]
MIDYRVTEAEIRIEDCLNKNISFAVIAGAGSGKTSLLIKTLKSVLHKEGRKLRQNGQKIACITFTKRAVNVIKKRLEFDDVFEVSTLHSFLWAQLSGFNHDIRKSLINFRLPLLIEKEKGKDNGGKSKSALAARNKAELIQRELDALHTVSSFHYSDSNYGNYLEGKLGHDDIISIAVYLLNNNVTFRKILGLRYPYIFIDEAQDTNGDILAGFNLLGDGNCLPLTGYFGDPWQQIYDGSIGDFFPPKNGEIIKKDENFRCSISVIKLLNAFRKDLCQYPAGENSEREGSVVFHLIKAEVPELPRNQYSEEQISRALSKMDKALMNWAWDKEDNVMRLFLVRQMIARRLGFPTINKLFTGGYSSIRSQELFESGEHYLLHPLISLICPLIISHQKGDKRKVLSVLQSNCPFFNSEGPNATKSLQSIIDLSVSFVEQLYKIWCEGTIRDILQFCMENQLIEISDLLQSHLLRNPRTEIFDPEVHGIEKNDWLTDSLFSMDTKELMAYYHFISQNTPYSTQHGVKGEEYKKVLVVYDDVEASWNNYNFGKILTPGLSGHPTEGQLNRGRKLAYVSFSRALDDLRVILFTPDPEEAKNELLGSGLLCPDQVELGD